MATAVMWFRRDLRLADHPALLDAVSAGGGRVVGLFVVDPLLWDQAGTPRRDHLIASLRSLSGALDGRLVVRRGDPATVVPAVAGEVEAASVHISADYGPYGQRRDSAVEEALGCPLVRTGSPYAVAPGRVLTQQGSSYLVFTPYFRSWLEHGWRQPVDAPASVEWVELQGEELPEVEVVAGEALARKHWEAYLDEVAEYRDVRDRPDLDATSRMSVPLKYGEIHPRTMLADLAQKRSAGAEAYRRELAWREFCADLLTNNPDAAWKPLRAEFEKLEYDEPGAGFDAWCRGLTGYPIVDAGMRELAETGFMHNRVRMVVASFLVKDLQVHWRFGARWFMQHLVDGDLASNSLNWQWVAGCGADASPYFRVFNPSTQAKKFDPDGEYQRRWIPELGTSDYPKPIVDHAEARLEALRRYDAIR
ncbi:deoxyribodipyrimidine photo-lyase [Streptomyces sp. SID13031]|uniref:cryptochrome/photolyase family protein n=1 Tax=Streptomyces sp. SID13031 TaxID=2706046 RepID=UPI0013CBD037|nr:deoxyribodipyrimidine photo-lyase [Streptomyces sp. SID13031]NEA37392.1 deoxyribodipyrimidine photo-lyase [Streptomyces sp. SID13031]